MIQNDSSICPLKSYTCSNLKYRIIIVSKALSYVDKRISKSEKKERVSHQNSMLTCSFLLFPSRDVTFLLHIKFATLVILIMQAVLYEEYFKLSLERMSVRAKRKLNEK